MPCLLKNIHFNHPVSYKTGQDLYSHVANPLQISIHPPRAGWDLRSESQGGRDNAISIHPPRAGWDLVCCIILRTTKEFQSTHPVRGGTVNGNGRRTEQLFQSTHPVRGGTPVLAKSHPSQSHFNPPTPCGVGRLQVQLCLFEHISIHPPRAGWDKPPSYTCLRINDFNPPTPCGVGRQYPNQHTIVY